MRREHRPLSPRYPDSQGNDTHCVCIHLIERYFVPVFHTISKVIFRLKLRQTRLNCGSHFP